MTKLNFPAPEKTSIDQQEQDILKFWQNQQIFEKSVSSRSKNNEYVFYDGPPFATGMPHYGHFLASIIKDVIPRYQTMLGKRVERTWGWDCHGLPIENIVEEELGTKSKKDIEDKIGVHEFNEKCRSKVLYFADEWEKIIHRLGRWVDFENGYKTMDKDFMESVMWVFADLHAKNLIYEGKRISLYCPRCATPLSNFEIAMDNSYQMRHDLTATVEFELETGEIALAWTTTPWTLPSNVAIGFGRDLEYSKITISSVDGIVGERNEATDYSTGATEESIIDYGKTYIIATDAIEKVFKGTDIMDDFENLGDIYSQIKAEKHKIEVSGKLRNYKIEKCQGKDFKNISYKPLFPHFANPEDGEKRFVAIHDDGDYISTEAGTGIVHFAPYFGEEDFHLCKKWDIYGIDPLLEDGTFGPEVPEFEGQLVVDSQTNKNVIAYLKEAGKLFHSDQYSHSYPHCWRCETPLIYKTQLAYFLDVQKIKKEMLKNNENINWEPEHLKGGRFAKGLESAPDWNLSRNRFWGSPIPIWKCDDEECDHQDVIGSVADLEKISGETVDDLHKHFVDKITWDCSKCEGKMVRTPEVLDCWFESGSMPYAQKHFPFSTDEKEFKNIFPGDFIAEYIAQTRGWFYTLHVLSTALFNTESFKHVICTGTILAEDGNKMSKSKKNYPDPSLIFEKYGSDAMRFYLMSSSVMKGENFNFTERGVADVLKTIILPLKSAYQFFSTYANIDDWKPTQITFIRHGEGAHNVDGIYSGKIDNPHDLTEKGVADIENLKDKLPNFDNVYSSPFVRTKHTADILFGKDKYTLDDRVVEIDFGDLEGQSYRPVLERLKDKSGESLVDIQSRMADFITEITEKHRGEHVAIVSHGGTIRYGRGYFDGYDTEDEVLNYEIVKPGGCAEFFCPPMPKTELDQWIISELQILLKEYRTSMDAYKISDACELVAPFIDNLNNWFLRRSRKRFWANGMTEEKVSGYETLHYVLRTLAKILAPTMPFFAEKLYKDLTDEALDVSNSVHLKYLPYANEKLIDAELSQKIMVIRESVSLAAGIRARKKIKLRQPLGKLSISIAASSNSLLKDEDLQIIADEANVKNVEILDAKEITKFAKQIVKVDARQVGRKFGKKVQELIAAGKNGDFKALDNGKIEIAGEVLESGEYEFSYLTEEGIDADSTTQVVVLLETEISEELRIEGIAREIIRAIQEKRKIDGFKISDRITVKYSTDSDDINQAFAKFGDMVQREVLANEITCGNIDGDGIEIEGDTLMLTLTK